MDVRTGWHVVRTGWHVVRTADRESEIFYLFRSAESSENALTSGILVYNIFTHKWFCPNTEWGQNTNKLPLWPFWDKNHLTGLEIHSRSKSKITPLFVTKGQRVKWSNEKNHTTITFPQSLKSTRVNRVIISTNKKLSKIQNNRKIEKSLQVAQKRGT
jgi:hypothetical protein